MRILDRYILVGGVRFMSAYMKEVAALFEALIGNLKEEGTIFVLKPLDTLIQLFAAQVPTMPLPLPPFSHVDVAKKKLLAGAPCSSKHLQKDLLPSYVVAKSMPLLPIEQQTLFVI